MTEVLVLGQKWNDRVPDRAFLLSAKSAAIRDAETEKST
jgi:hypothetical protein